MDVSEMLNEYFGATVPVIARELGGVVDKLIGVRAGRTIARHPGWPRFRVVELPPDES
jgi:hypothetical protein